MTLLNLLPPTIPFRAPSPFPIIGMRMVGLLPDPMVETRLLHALQNHYVSQYGEEACVSVNSPNEDFFYAHADTEALLKDPKIRVILRPAFFWRERKSHVPDMGIGARAAALIRQSDDTFVLSDLKAKINLYKVKRDLVDGKVFESRTIKDFYLLDLAIKLFLAKESGIPVSRAQIIHLSGQKVFGETVEDSASLFEFADLTQDILNLQESLTPEIESVRAKHREFLVKETKEQTSKEEKSLTPIGKLYYLTDKLKAQLSELGIHYVEELQTHLDNPDSPLGLTPIQRRQVLALTERRIVVEDQKKLQKDLKKFILDPFNALKENGGVISFFDVEGITPQIALLRGTTNGQPVTLQFSNHFIDGEGQLSHRQFAFDGDPLAPKAGEKLDRDIAEAILKSLGPSGPVLSWYASYELSILRELSARLLKNGEPHLAHQLDLLSGDIYLKDLIKKLESEGKKQYARELSDVIADNALTKKYINHLRKKGDEEGLLLADEIEGALKETRFVDPLQFFRNHVYHPDLEDFFTLKSVYKAFFPDRSHFHLEEVQKGGDAPKAWEEMLDPNTSPERKAELRLKLLSYCGRDTQAMVLLLEKLFELAELPWPFPKNI